MIRVSEIFGPTIQGEGALIGLPTVFVRTGGCDYRCSWCDTPHAVLPEHLHSWKPMSPEAILERVEALAGGPILVTLSGGNPVLQPLGALIDLGVPRGYTFALETQGSQTRPWLARLNHLCVSPKPPSAQVGTCDWEALDRVLSDGPASLQCSLKVVCFNEEDYRFARSVHNRYPWIPFYLQAGNKHPTNVEPSDTLSTLRWLVDRASQDRWREVRILPQLHVLLWGNARAV